MDKLQSYWNMFLNFGEPNADGLNPCWKSTGDFHSEGFCTCYSLEPENTTHPIPLELAAAATINRTRAAGLPKLFYRHYIKD